MKIKAFIAQSARFVFILIMVTLSLGPASQPVSATPDLDQLRIVVVGLPDSIKTLMVGFPIMYKTQEYAANFLREVPDLENFATDPNIATWSYRSAELPLEDIDNLLTEILDESSALGDTSVLFGDILSIFAALPGQVLVLGAQDALYNLPNQYPLELAASKEIRFSFGGYNWTAPTLALYTITDSDTKVNDLLGLLQDDPDLVVAPNTIHYADKGCHTVCGSATVCAALDSREHTAPSVLPSITALKSPMTFVLDTPPAFAPGQYSFHEAYSNQLGALEILPGNYLPFSAVDAASETGSRAVDNADPGLLPSCGCDVSDHGFSVAQRIFQVHPQARVMYMTVLNAFGAGDAFGLASALADALQIIDASNKPSVINLSLDYDRENLVVAIFIQAAKDFDAAVVAAAGNQGTPRIAPQAQFPAAYGEDENFPHVFSIGATDANNPSQRSIYSNSPGTAGYLVSVGKRPDVNTAEEWMDICSQYPYGNFCPSFYAPRSHQYQFELGTSFAAPGVSGLASACFGQGGNIQHLHSLLDASLIYWQTLNVDTAINLIGEECLP